MQVQVRESRQDRRVAAGRSGSCMVLWRHQDVRSALWASRQPRRASAEAPPARAVRVGVVAPGELERLRDRDAPPLRAIAPPLADPVRDAWVDLVTGRLAGQEVCFFTGTYRDDYGFSMGLMAARNVQRDFRRFLKEQGLEAIDWVCAVEPHRYRVILHLHALLAGVDPRRSDELKRAWDLSRGWSTAPVCTDGGISYTCKYALKAAEADSFAWSW
jgi:hypothetical protein